ncbi:group XIIA secretory phospholipase A2-like protein [Dinothrombium tinctorium]|uniref:Group XIIA secretory phospholipase A2-like protein n=1 Tax=Dinothrombium tinctorium TaxID=1965070 RepID=A0A3S3RV82_9ACAR|nr:group XIIA secretory phospholipase A2-like protein [Dinothrombium tinctorium]RWS06505.1 group XIIA secretory phospholipase A2-like protein [Dinothrombium tinctorium]RWS06545.1 group XIIA secretory phospholipase A2-like protein [Dinothrombium tinctorium]
MSQSNVNFAKKSQFNLGALGRKPVNDQVNGCGTNKIAPVVNLFLNKKHIDCCNAHDLCYSDCTIKKAECDLKLKECFLQVHNEKLADLIYSVLQTQLACEAFLMAQEKSCNCKK